MSEAVKIKPPPSLAEITQNIQGIFRIKSLETLKLTLNTEHIGLQEIDNQDDFLYGQMMGCVLIHGSSIKASFKIHYSQNLATLITSESLGISPKEISQDSTNDFMREYCNLAAGYIVDTLAYNKIHVDISIPLITDGFDEVWFSDHHRPLDQKDYFRLCWPMGNMICTNVIQIRNLEPFDNLKIPESPHNNVDDDDEGITFL